MPATQPDLDRSSEALAFREVRMPQGRVLAARGKDGSLYCYGRVSAESPLCAWRQTPSGDRQWLAFDVTDQHTGTQACRRAAASSTRGDPLATMDWPINGSADVATMRRTPVRLSRDADGVRFEPLAHGAPSLALGGRNLAETLSGAAPVRLAGLGTDSRDATVRVLTAMRDAKGVLSPGERLRAGATLALLSSDLPESSSERRLLERTLGRFCAAICPMLDLHSPRGAILDVARDALALLDKAPAKAVTFQARAWLVGEAAPVLALLQGRFDAHEAEMHAVDWAEEPAAPAFA